MTGVMSLPIRSLTLVCIYMFGVAQLVRAEEIFFLHDADEHQWCGYANKDNWTSHFQREDVDVMGSLMYSNRRITQINMRQISASGDWALDDEYTLNPSQNLQQLKRDLGYFSENERVLESFRIRDGKAVLISRSASNLTTHKPSSSSRPIDAFGSWPIITKVTDFPFQSLLQAIGEVRSKGSYCLHD